MESIADNSVGGNSEILDFNIQEQKLILKYRIKSGYAYPYCGITFTLAEKMPFADLRDYDFLSIRIYSTSTPNARLFFKTFEEGVSKLREPVSFRHVEKKISFIEGQTDYRIPLDQFITNEWWYDLNAVKKEDLPRDNLLKAAAFDIQFVHTRKTAPEGKENICIIGSIIIEKDFTLLQISAVIILIIYYIILVLKGRKKTKISKIQKTQPYKKQSIDSYSDEETRKVFLCIEKNCFTPGFSLKNIESYTGYSSTKINTLLKNKTGKTFKKILNDLRLTEAKKLLTETDRQIIDIAFSVGYNNISYFNQIFRKYENRSPKEYRRAPESF